MTRTSEMFGFCFQEYLYPFLQFRTQRGTIRVHHPSPTPAAYEVSLDWRCNDPPHFITRVIDSIASVWASGRDCSLRVQPGRYYNTCNTSSTN